MSKISVGHPNLGLTLFIVSWLPNALDDAVHDLINVSAFNPYVFCTHFVMTSDNRLLDNDRRRGNHNRSRCYYGRLRYHNCRGAGGFINRRGDETCSKYSCSNSNSLAVSMMMMTMVMARRRRRRHPIWQMPQRRHLKKSAERVMPRVWPMLRRRCLAANSNSPRSLPGSWSLSKGRCARL